MNITTRQQSAHDNRHQVQTSNCSQPGTVRLCLTLIFLFRVAAMHSTPAPQLQSPSLIRVHTQSQYEYVRDQVLNGPEMILIVWQDGAYREIKASPPGRKFNVNIRNYIKAQ